MITFVIRFSNVHDPIAIDSISLVLSVRQYVQFTVHDFLFLLTKLDTVLTL